MDTYHLLPSRDGWQLRHAVTGKVEKFANDRDVLLRMLPGPLGNQGVLVVIHRADGSVEEERRYPPMPVDKEAHPLV